MKDSKEIIMNITNMEDIKKLKSKKNIKYINIDIKKPDLEAICYLIENGQNYSYSEKIDEERGYIYVSHEIFKQAQLFILEILNKVSLSLNELEIARYLYITIGKNIGYDINSLPEKNETFNFKNINLINNIWGSIYYGKGTNISFTKLYLYLCSFMNIDCEIIKTKENQKNVLTIENRKIITNLTQDVPYIQGNFKTKNFIGYNDNLKLDKKIGYIEDDYSEIKIESTLKNIDYQDENILKNILEKTSNIIKIKNIKPIELSMIYKEIFEKYCPNIDIKINNLYMNHYPYKEHFIVISSKNNYYCFNYTLNKFVTVDEKILIENINQQKIGIYQNEKIPFTTKKGVHALS